MDTKTETAFVSQTIRLPASLMIEIRTAATAGHRSVNQQCRLLLEQALNNRRTKAA